MPRLSELLTRPSNIIEGTEQPLPQPHLWGMNLPADQQQPPPNSSIRCPLPPIWNSSPDSLRQFYSNTAAKFRVFTQK